MSKRRLGMWTLGVLLSGAIWPLAGFAFANVAVGDVIENVELPTLDGSRHALLSKKALANVFIFFRPQQDHSLSTLQQMAKCEKEFAGKAVSWVAIVSSSWDAAEVRKVVTESGIAMPVLVDKDDELYGRIGVRLHPVIGVANEKGQLVAYEPFHKINYCDRIRAKIRYALHEIDLAEVQRSENPEKALFPNQMKNAIEHRHVKMGEHYLGTKQFDKAEQQAHLILEKNPSYAPAQLLLGDALAGQGKCPEAKSAYQAAQQIDPAAAAEVQKRAPCAAR